MLVIALLIQVILFTPAAIVLLAFTVIVKPELVAGEPVKQGEAFEVITQRMISLLIKFVPETPV